MVLIGGKYFGTGCCGGTGRIGHGFVLAVAVLVMIVLLMIGFDTGWFADYGHSSLWLGAGLVILGSIFLFLWCFDP